MMYTSIYDGTIGSCNAWISGSDRAGIKEWPSPLFKSQVVMTGEKRKEAKTYARQEYIQKERA